MKNLFRINITRRAISAAALLALVLGVVVGAVNLNYVSALLLGLLGTAALTLLVFLVVDWYLTHRRSGADRETVEAAEALFHRDGVSASR